MCRSLLTAVAVACGWLAAEAQEPNAPADVPDRAALAERVKRVRADAAAHADREQAAADARAAELAASGITAVVPLRALNDPARSVDIVFIGDGFTQAEQAEWEAVVTRMVANFDTPPFDVHADRVNFYRLNLVSPESGVDVEATTVDTPLGGAIRPAGAGNMLTVDVRKTVDLCRAAVPELDFVMAVLNTHGKFLGSANTGPIVRLSTSGGHQKSIVMHEFAHNFGAFLDEYVDGKQGGGRAPPPQIEGGINASLESNVYLAKWHHWNVPEDVFRGTVRQRGKPFAFGDVVRCYEGSATFFNDVYRAQENCHMQRGRGKAFCVVCAEGLEVGLFRFVAPIARVHPSPALQRIGQNDTLALAVEPIALRADTTQWHVRFWQDGAPVADRKVKTEVPRRGETGAPRWVCSLDGHSLGLGRHHITATVDFASPRVHMDRGRLSGAFGWIVEVTPRGPLCKAPTAVAGTVGQEVRVFVEHHPDGAPGAWSCANPPAGATVETHDGTTSVKFTPTRAGAYRLEFRQTAEEFVARRSVDVTVKSADAGGNAPPAFAFHAPARFTVGVAGTLQLLAYDPDDDHLAYDGADLPAGATLHPDTGRIAWTPDHTQAGAYALSCTVTDGSKRAKTTCTIQVAGVATHRGIFGVPSAPAFTREVEWQCIALHSEDKDLRWRAVERLDAAAPDVAHAHWWRLLRLPQPRVWKHAADRLRAQFAARAAQSDQVESTRHLPLFLEHAPRHVWRFVDAPEKLACVRELCTTALATPELPAKTTREIHTLVSDLDLIDWYNAQRRSRPGPEPIRDKKFK